MTSKLWKTIVGVGIALGAAPACLGRTGVAGEPAREEAGDPEVVEPPVVPEGGPVDAGRPYNVETPDSGVLTDASAPIRDAATDAPPLIDASLDATSDAAADPFCDVAWPPTKGGPFPPSAPCYDPFRECDDAVVPRGCYDLYSPGVCSYSRTWEGPLICIDGEWRCPPGTEDGPRCVCFGPLPAGETCLTDAGG